MIPDQTNSRHKWLAVACALAAGLPFLTKPFTIDDPVVLEVSEQILKNPLRPYAGWLNWLGDYQTMFETTTNPPMLSYYLAPFLGIWGYSEIALHGAMTVFLVILALAMAALSERFTRGNRWPLLFVIFSPGIVVSLNTMRDVPGTALVAAGLACYVLGCDRENRKLLALGGFLAGCAVPDKYSHFILFPILASYALLQRKPSKLVWLLIPAAMVGAWFAQNLWAYGETHFGYLARVRRSDTSFTWIDKLRGGTTILGSLLLLWPAMMVHDVRTQKWWRLWVCVVVTILGLLGVRSYFNTFPMNPGIEYYLWSGLGTWSGTWLLLAAVEALIQGAVAESDSDPTTMRRDIAFLLIWASGHLAISVFAIFFQAVRHIIPAFPPLALLIVLFLQAHGGRATPLAMRWTLSLSLAVQIVLTIMVGIGDHEFATVPRRFIREEFPRIAAQAVEEGREVWFRGSWGWRTYARNAGMINSAGNGPAPPEGALLVQLRYTYGGPRAPAGFDTERLLLLEEHEYPSRVPVRTMRALSGFYATMGPTVPFRFSNEVQDVVEVYRVGPPLARSPRQQESEA